MVNMFYGEGTFLKEISLPPHKKTINQNKGEPPTRVLPLPLRCKGIHPLLRFRKDDEYFALCGERQGLHALDLCKLLKKLDQNFPTGFVQT